MSYNNSDQPEIYEMILNPHGSEGSSVSSVKKQEEFEQSDWHAHHDEGQLAVDVAQTKKEVYVISTLAGALADKLEIYVHNDLLTIRGIRRTPLSVATGVHYFHKECYWGKFSRTIVLPVEVKGDLARAEYSNGVLVIRAPKQVSQRKIPITIIED
ncbi:MAG: hypothetical protein CL685_04100 [Candidatus Magasanikbacteria bacterium]|nr:hypothetical protein [Candidatus Magasanikbacteria bacterium]|tara:strand:- start:239 stop:706 length:468 start_codon:yes stop_codon:yes gene_type:complete